MEVTFLMMIFPIFAVAAENPEPSPWLKKKKKKKKMKCSLQMCCIFLPEF